MKEGIGVRKRIAIFANGWGYEYLQKCGNGMRRAAMKNNIDMFEISTEKIYI